MGAHEHFVPVDGLVADEIVPEHLVVGDAQMAAINDEVVPGDEWREG